MKPTARSIVEFALFLCILILSLAVLHPLMQQMEHKLAEVRTRVLTYIEQTYNLKITYESLSPSLLRSVSLRNVKIYDAEHNTEIAAFEDISLRYRFWKLLFGNTSEVLDSARIANGFVTLDLLENTALAEKLNTLQASSQESSREEDSATTEELLSFFSAQTLTVEIKNVRLRYRDAIHTADAQIAEGSCRLDSEALTVSLTSTASYRNASLSDIGTAETAFTIDGKFNKDLSTGSAVANFSHISTDVFGIDRLKLFTGYRDKTFTFNTMQDFQPMDLMASWNIETNDMSGKFSCKDFMPLRSVSLYKVPKNLVQFSSLAMSGDAQFTLSAQQLQWNTDMRFVLPPLELSSFRLEDAVLHIAADGSDKDITVSELALSAENADVFSKFAVNLEKKLPSGQLEVRKLILPSGASLAADIGFSVRDKTFTCSIPSVQLGDGILRNIALNITPSGQKADYTLSAEDEYGKYSFDGSYIYDADSKTASQSPHFLELHGAFDAVGIGTVAKFIHAALPDASIPVTAAEALQCTTEFYISTDLKSFSYNCIRFVLVSNAVNDFYALVSVKGNQNSFSLTDIDIAYKNMSLKGTINADFETLNDIIFNSNLAINAIGYQIQGFYSQNVLNIYGDYGLAVSALYDKTSGLQGSIKMTEMPLPFLPLFLTLESGFRYTTPENWEGSIDTGYLSYGSPASLRPTALGISFRGGVNQSGLLLPEIKLGTDEALTGSLNIAFPAAAGEGQAPAAYTAALNLASPDETEKIEFNAEAALTDLINVSGSLKLDRISLARFIYTQSKENRVSADANFAFTPDSISGKLSVPEFSVFVRGNDLRTSGSLVLADQKADITIDKAEWGSHQVSSITGSFSATDLTGTLNADYAGKAATKQMKAHIRSVFTGVQSDSEKSQSLLTRLTHSIEQFTLNTYISNWQFDTETGKDEVPISLIREKDITALYAGKNDEITGFILNDGVVSLKLADTLPLRFSLDGKITKDTLDVTVSELRADIKKIWDITGLDYVKFYTGALTGNLAITGKPLEPDFSGKLEGRNITVNSPRFAPETFGPVALDIIADGTMLEVPYTVLKGPSTDVWARCTAEFSGWIPDDVSVQCGTLGTKKGVMKTDNVLFKADGLASGTVDLNITPTRIGLYGSAAFDSGYFVIRFSDFDTFASKKSSSSGIAFDMKLDVQLGHKAEFRWPTSDIPILKALVPTEAPLTLAVDGNTGSFSIKGNVKMRGGEVFYIKRNFYIREGTISFLNATSNIEPYITLRAEIRDRDESGEPLRLILTAKDQPLFSFNPTLNSDPPRSTNEIMQLLGQVAIGDTGKENVWQSLLASGSDILAQVGFLKKAETRVRDFLKLDAFSFRTLLLQNAILGNLFNLNKNTTLTLSNYLDNTSVYIGKYFGSAIYADALLHLSHYDETSLKNGGDNRPVYKNLLFQPEVGLEMATPFFMLRWSVAPTKPDTLFVGDAALTFSWKYSY